MAAPLAAFAHDTGGVMSPGGVTSPQPPPPPPSSFSFGAHYPLSPSDHSLYVSGSHNVLHGYMAGSVYPPAWSPAGGTPAAFPYPPTPPNQPAGLADSAYSMAGGARTNAALTPYGGTYDGVNSGGSEGGGWNNLMQAAYVENQQMMSQRE